MCACKFKVGKADAPGNFENFILADAFAKGDFESTLDFIFCVSPEKVKEAFRPLGLEVKSYQDIKTLALAHEQGLDVKEFQRDFKTIALSIRPTQLELDNASCKTMFITP